MEQLQSLLRQYNLLHQDDITLAPWSKQYMKSSFPKYWMTVYYILQSMDKNYKVLEVGCGLGDITAILCYLGFKNIVSVEKDKHIFNVAQRRIEDMFGMKNIVINENFPNNRHYTADILILVNCAYAERTKTKRDYMKLLKKYYNDSGCPKYFLMEVIDSSYTERDEEFPIHIRLSSNDVRKLFPNCDICFWKTYKYPTNRKSKTLYLIRRL